ncbi:hypothetical protein ACFL2J_05830 [Candidatus Omnitrophota bacterium]
MLDIEVYGQNRKYQDIPGQYKTFYSKKGLITMKKEKTIEIKERSPFTERIIRFQPTRLTISTYAVEPTHRTVETRLAASIHKKRSPWNY